MVLNWFTQVAFSPRLVAIGLQNTAYSHRLVKESGVFAVNIFRKEDAEIVKSFSKSRAKNPDKMKDAKYTDGPETGVPIIDGAAAHIECNVVQMVDTGSGYDVLIGEVVDAGVNKPGKPEDTLTLPDVGWSYAG
jgi:flavin reductase (DIM6/NTAB) family NADH-FMN oxidoreductase RutF